MKLMTQGILLCIFSQLLFGVLYLFSLWLQPLSGTDVFAWRMVTMIFGLLLILFPTIGCKSILHLITNILGYNWKRWILFLLGTLDAGSQFWLFMWAPLNNEGVNIAMGYFLFPLVMALFGRIWLKEQLSSTQKIALLLAACGVFHELWHTQSFSWTSLWVCAIYPFYYLSRKAMKIPALQGITLDVILISIPSIIYLSYQSDSLSLILHNFHYWYFFAVLSYIEPVLLFLVAVFILNIPMTISDYFTYVPIWLSLGLLGLNGLIKKRDNY